MDGFMKGMIAGAVLGAGAAMLKPLDRKGVKRMKSRVERAARTAGDMMDHMVH